LNQDSGDVQSAISDKLGQLIKALATFFTGAVIEGGTTVYEF
jgi:hypothetical protein